MVPLLSLLMLLPLLPHHLGADEGPSINAVKRVLFRHGPHEGTISGAPEEVESAIIAADNEVAKAIFVPIHHLGAAEGTNINAVKRAFFMHDLCQMEALP